jgi:hypothetical protein
MAIPRIALHRCPSLGTLMSDGTLPNARKPVRVDHINRQGPRHLHFKANCMDQGLSALPG